MAKKEYLALAVFAVLIALFYGNTLFNGFIYDDFQQVVDNEYVHSLRYLPKVVTGCTWEHAFGECKDRAIYYRPIQSLSYLLTYQISSEAWIFHLVNLLYLFIIVSLIFFLAKILTNNFIFSFLASLFFLVHPIHAEVVNWIAAVPELTFAIFVLLAAIFYLKYHENPTRQKLALISLFYFLALLSKEPAIFLPLIFVFIDFTFFKIKFEDFLSLKHIKNYLILAIVASVYLLMRMAVLGGGLIQAGNSPHSPFSLSERIYSFFYLFFQYLSKLLYPFPRVFFYYFEKKSNFLNPEFLFAFLAVLIFAALTLFFYQRGKKLLALSLLWLFIFLLPVLIFIESAGEAVFSERYLFVPGIGFSLALSYLFTYLWQKKRGFIRIGLSAILIFILIFAFLTIRERNLIWKDNESLYTKTLAQNPRAYPIRFNYAVLLRTEKGDFEAAKDQLEILLEQNPKWGDIPMVYLHLGDYYQAKNQPEKAIEYYHKSVAASQDWKTNFAYNRLGVFYAKREEYLNALIYFCKSTQASPESMENKANFDRAVSIVGSKYKEDPNWLYNKITDGTAFIKSSEEKIQFKDKVCQEDSCFYIFLPRFGEYEIILPFIIVASTPKNEAVRAENPTFNPNTGEAALTVDPKYKDETLTFLFPTCEGIYYTAKTSSTTPE